MITLDGQSNLIHVDIHIAWLAVAPASLLAAIANAVVLKILPLIEQQDAITTLLADKADTPCKAPALCLKGKQAMLEGQSSLFLEGRCFVAGSSCF